MVERTSFEALLKKKKTDFDVKKIIYKFINMVLKMLYFFT